jgi:ribosomal protein L44E
MNLFKNKKGQRKKKHVQRGTGKKKKTIFAGDNQQSRRFEARLAPRRCSIQNSPQKYNVRKLEKLGLVQQSLEDQ